MSALQSSIASALHAANIGFSGGIWLRLKGDGLDATSVNAESGGWRDHRTGEHGNFRALAGKLGIDDSGVYIPHQSADWQQAAATNDSRSQQFARTHWARGIPAVKPARQKGWSLAAWDADQAQYQDCRDAIYDYLASRGLDPLPLLPLIRIQPQLLDKGMDVEMQDAGADFYFFLPMYEIGKPQVAANICGIQRTYLKFAEDKYHPVAKIGRAMLGKKGVTALDPHKNPITTLPTNKRVLGAGEGFETVASFVQVTGHGGLIAWDWSGLKTWSKDVQIRATSPLLAFLVDADTSQTGQRESAAAVRRITAQEHGRAVYLLPPDSITPDAKGNRDWNDLLRQYPDDFAVEIVNAWHKSDANLALAPIAPDTDAPVVVDYSGPSEAQVKQAIADAVDRHATSLAVEKEIAEKVAGYPKYRKLLAEWSALTPEERKAKKIKRPKFGPLLIKVSTGVGKTHQVLDLIKKTEIPLLIQTPNHELAAEYAKAGAFPYHGRSEPAIQTDTYTLDFVEKNKDEFIASDCFKYPLVKITGANNHVPALTACRSCEHGRKFILENYDNKSKPYQDAEAWFGHNNVDKKTVPACLWLSHQMAASHARIVVAPNASFSESLATWQTPDGPIPRLVIVDEIPDLTREIAAHSGDLGAAIENAQKNINILRSSDWADGTTFQTSDEKKAETAAIIADLEAAGDLLRRVSAWLGSTAGDGLQKIPDEIVDLIEKLHNAEWFRAATARWEKAEIKYGHEPFVPLRMMKAVVESIRTRTASAHKGVLHVREVTALGDYITKGKPCILLDATPSRAVETLVMDKDGQIVQAIAKQHINLVHHHQYLHGRTWHNKEHQAEEMARLLAMREQMQAETGNTPNVLTYMPFCTLAGTKDDADWGYFGRDDVGQDRWKAQDLLIFGGPLLGPDTQAIAYNAELMLMRLAGVKNLPDWSTEIDRDQDITVGNKLIPSKAPLPTDPALRDWVLADYGRRVAQAIGRVRGVWASESKPINVWVAGGLPLAGLAEHGIAVNEYRQEKTVNLNDEKSRKTLEKVQVAVASLQAADQDPTYRAINRWLADHGLPGVQYKAWEKITSKASTTSYNDTYGVVDSLLASFGSLQKVADWQGQDISDVALGTWDAPNIDPEIKIAAEIILQVSPHTDNWRQKQPDG